MNDTVLEIKNLSKSFAKNTVLNGINLSAYLTDDGKNITAEMEFTSPDIVATPILAVYDNGRFVGEDVKIVENGEGNVLLNVCGNVSEDTVSKIFIWKDLSKGIPYSKEIVSHFK